MIEFVEQENAGPKGTMEGTILGRVKLVEGREVE